MSLSAVRFGHIGIMMGPKEKARTLLAAIEAKEGPLYKAENWAPGSDLGLVPAYAYVTGEHWKPGYVDTPGEPSKPEAKPSFPELFHKFHDEYRTSESKTGLLNEEVSVAQCRSGQGEARIHQVFKLA